MEPPKYSSILRKTSTMPKPIGCVQFTKAVLRHANIRDQKPSLGLICPGDPHHHNPLPQNLRIGLKKRRKGKSDTPVKPRGKWQEGGTQNNILLTFGELGLPSPSTIKPEEREFVVDSGASMHMISKKDLYCAELETVTTSRSPMTVITANGEVQTNAEATVYVREFDIFLTMKLLEDTPAVLSLGKLCDEHGHSYDWINGQKPNLIENGIRIQCDTENFVPIVVLGLSTTSSSSSTSTPTIPSGQEIDHSDHHPAIESSESVDRQARRNPYASETREELLHEPTEIQKPNENEDPEKVRVSPYSDIPERLQEFRENLVDERVLEYGDSHASSSHEPPSEPMRSVDLGKHSIKNSLPEENRNCDICMRTKITRAPCRRRIGRVVLCAENFGDLITADHKIVSEGCESRNNHRYAVVVQDLATQWIQS